MVESFVGEIQGKDVATPTVSFEEALHAQRIFDAIHASAGTWVPI